MLGRLNDSSYFSQYRPEIIEQIPIWAKRILDVGCGVGTMGAAIKARLPECQVTGIEINPDAAAHAQRVLDRVIIGDVSEVVIPVEEGGYDVIVCADVLEHLPDPWAVMRRLVSLLNWRGQIVVSLPNLRNILEIETILNGTWSYQPEGIFDRTHLRFFTPRRAKEFLENAGLYVHTFSLKPDVRLSLPKSFSRLPQDLSVGSLIMTGVSDVELEELTALQVIMVAGRKRWDGGRSQLQGMPTAETEISSIIGRGPQVSVIIVNWNGLELLKRCLSAVRKNSGPANRYELIVVDNGSTDGSLEFLTQQADVKLIRNEENVGYTLACNQGAELASGQYLLFLNNDTEPQPGWLEALLEAARYPDVGAVGAKLLYPDGSLQEAGGIIFQDGSGWNYGRGSNPALPEFSRRRDVDYCSGAALLVQAQAFWAAGGLDPRYAPAYYEDTDLCFSLRSKGWRVIYEPRAVVVHAEGGTAGRDLSSGLKQYQVVNKEKFRTKWLTALRRHYPPDSRLVPVAATRTPPLRILVVDNVPPVYDRASGSQRLYQIMRLMLDEGHTVGFFCRASWGLDSYLRTLRGMGIEATAEGIYPEEQAVQANFLRFLTYFDPDVVWFEGFEVTNRYLKLVREFLPGVRVITDSIDLHFLREKRLAETDREAQKPDWVRTMGQELKAYGDSDLIITVTVKEKEVLSRLLSRLPITVVPNIHDPEPWPVGFSQREGLLFVGNFLHQPNVDGILWFLEEIWPLLVQEEPKMKCFIVGNAPPPIVREKAEQAQNFGGKIVITGYVPDLKSYLSAARLSIAPLRAGAGMKGKIAEALAAGLPVVTTSIGAEGMDLENEVEALIADDVPSFAAAVLRLYRDESAWQKLSQNGPVYVRNRYSSDVVALALRETLNKAVDISAPAEGNPGGLGMWDQVRLQAAFSEDPGLTSIIIPCYNGVELTRACVQSILRNTKGSYELIFIDNGSTDDTPRFFEDLQKSHDNVTVITNHINAGFAFACNQGLAKARGRQVVILNNDVVVPEDWLSPLLAALKKPGVGLVGPRSNNVSGLQLLKVPYGSDLLAMEDFAKVRRRDRAGSGFYTTRAVGFCLVVKREVIEAIGGFDPDFTSGNFEDDDFCLRAQLAGYKIWIASDAFVHHHGSQTFISQKIDYGTRMRRNFDVFRAKWSLPREKTMVDPLPYQDLLRRPFDPEWHYIPISLKEILARSTSPLSLREKKSFTFLLSPDWKEPGDRWLEAVASYLTTFSPDDDVALLLRIDPRLEPDVQKVINLVEERLQEIGLNPEEGPLLTAYIDPISPLERGSLYRTCQAYIDTAPPGVFNYKAQEAKAFGLKICSPSAEDLLAAVKGV